MLSRIIVLLGILLFLSCGSPKKTNTNPLTSYPPVSVEGIAKASKLTTQAQFELLHLIRGGNNESQVKDSIINTFNKNSAKEDSSLVSSGPNSANINYSENNRVMQTGDVVVVATGVKFEGYEGKSSRTYPVGGYFTTRQRQIYKLVIDAQREVVSKLKSDMFSLNEATYFVSDYFKNSGIQAKNKTGEYVSIEHFFLNKLGHYLNKKNGDYSSPLKVGDIISIEMGIYIEAEDIGIKVEDVYAITENGVERLAPFPCDIDTVEDYVQKATN